ncbi:MAG: DUF4363 family protein [Clostridia bacterium]|jgi:hypothetical protein|nr:DUF4363 family protein [Clostridia bacterium]
MRNWLIIILLSSLFLVTAVAWEGYINKEFSRMEALIKNAESKEDIEEITLMWESLSDKAEILIDHNDLEEVSKYLWAMSAEIDCDSDEFMESRQMASDIIEHIRIRNSTKFINIF